MKTIAVLTSILLISSACKPHKQATDASIIKSINPALNGTWELKYISAPPSTTNELYPTKKPTIAFDVPAGNVSGNTSCNSFSGKLKADGSNISFNDPMAMTKMFCPGNGESTFMETLRKVNKYSISDSTLHLIMGDIAIMQFVKRK